MVTTPRAVRIPDEVWHAAVEKAKAEGTTVTAVVLASLKRYLRRGVTPPPPENER